MSIEAVAATLHHSKAKGVSRAVLLAIAWHIGEDPTIGCWPSQERLAQLANTNTRQVQRAIISLVELGELESISHDGIGLRSDRKTNRYFIRVDCPQGCDNSMNHRSRPDIFDTTTRHLRRHDPTFTPSRPDNSVVLKVIKTN